MLAVIAGAGSKQIELSSLLGLGPRKPDDGKAGPHDLDELYGPKRLLNR